MSITANLNERESTADLDRAEAGSTAEVNPESRGHENEDNSAWRDELSARLTRYRARRKMRPPRYPSLRLPFDAARSLSEPVRSDDLTAPTTSEPITFEPMYDRALALDEMVCSNSEETGSADTTEAPINPPPARSGSYTGAKTISAKIIEFPRFALNPHTFEPPVLPPDQLAGPVSSRPRILEVPEIEPPLPALGGITIEPAQRQEAEKRIGIDVPLQSAALSRRIFASLIDGLIVAVASAVFGCIFWKVAAVRPPLMQIFWLTIGISLVFWAAYQYLLLVYARSTPGLLATGLELARFDGTPASRPLRRWRVLASYLSAASLGMGYAWVFLDEDVLCWHDRITHTYLARRSSQQKKQSEEH